jgi:hypothetical protein
MKLSKLLLRFYLVCLVTMLVLFVMACKLALPQELGIAYRNGMKVLQPSAPFEGLSVIDPKTGVVIPVGGGSVTTGSGTPQGNSGTPGATYYQQVSGKMQPWVLSPNAAVWANSVTGAVVYAGPATMYTTGFTNCLELNDGSGTSPVDACGHSAATIVGANITWNGTNGLTFPCCNFSQYVSLPGSTGVAHSTYMVCLNDTQTATHPGLLGDTIGNSIISFDNYGAIQTGSGGTATFQTSLQPIGITGPTCITVVYNGAGADQFWIGAVKLAIKNPGASAVTIPGGRTIGLGGSASQFGFYTLYKYYAIEGTELAPDLIQHNALVASARVASGTSLSTPTTIPNYLSGLPVGWFPGDSRTDGNGTPANTYVYSLATQVKVPGLLVFNAGTAGQKLLNYVAGGIFAQAQSLINQYTVPGQPTPPHFMGLEMSINDFGGGTTGAAAYASWQAAITSAYASGWKTIAFSVFPAASATSGANTERLAFNASLATGGYWDGFVDWANDLKLSNPAYAYNVFGWFTPYSVDGLHPTAAAAAAQAGRFETEMNRVGLIGKGANFTPAYSQYLDIDLAQGPSQTVTLTGNVSLLKLLNGNQGSKIDLTICQDATGGRTVTAPVVGSGATATVTSGGVITLTGGGSNYDQNFMPVLYTSGLTCTTYPRYSSTITNGVITGITQMTAGAGCSGTGSVIFVPTEPKWNNFNTAGVNGLAAGACLKQAFTFDGVGQTIN